MDRANITIFSLHNGREVFEAIKDHQTHFNTITKACIEQLEQPWFRFNGEVNYTLNSNASLPIGYIQLAWAWQGCPSTRQDTFIVVERATCGVILGASCSQRPRTSSAGVYTYGVAQRSKEEAERQNSAREQSIARQAHEKARQDAINRENREKEKKIRQENGKNT